MPKKNKWSCYVMKIKNKLPTVWCGNHHITFGLILPCKSGVLFKHQTGGVMCRHPEIEGVFIPLDDSYWDEKTKSYINLAVGIEQITQYPDKRDKRLKEVIKKLNLPLKLTRHSKIMVEKGLDSHFGGPYVSHEAWQWCVVTNLRKKVEDHGFHNVRLELQKLVGKEVILIYPNSD